MEKLMNVWLGVVAAVLVVGLCVGYSGGPPVGKTGAPGEGTCHDCHDDFGLNSGSAVFAISAADAHTGGNLSIGVGFSGSPTPRHGFQMTARDSAGNPAGSWQNTTPLFTQNNGPNHVNHRLAGTTQTNWAVNWVPPATLPAGPLTLYAAGNEANDDGDDDGDYIYTTSRKLYRASVSTAVTTWPLGTTQQLDLNAPHVPGHGYAMVATDSTQPTSLGGVFVAPLNGNTALAQLSLALPSVFQNFVGTLSPQGTATAAVAVPNIPSLSGLVAHLGFITFDPALLPVVSPTEVSNRLTVTLQ